MVCKCGKTTYVIIHGQSCLDCLKIKQNEIQKKIKNIYHNTAGTNLQIICDICKGPNIKCINNPILKKWPFIVKFTFGLNEICCDCLLRLADDETIFIDQELQQVANQ